MPPAVLSAPLQTENFSAWNVALDKDEKRLFVVNGLSDDLTVVDVPGAKPIKTVPVGRVPYGVVVVE